MPVLKVVVEVEAPFQHDSLKSLQQTDHGICKCLVWPKCVVKFTDVQCQIFQSRLSENGAVIAEVRGLSAVQVDLGVVGL